MEAYVTTCTDSRCGYVRKWNGYKTGIGKSDAQLVQMRKEENTCVRCGAKAETKVDPRGLIGAAESRAEARERRERLIADLSTLCKLDRDEIIDSALSLLGLAAVEVQKGKTVGIIDDANKTYSDVWVPALQNLRTTPTTEKSSH
jgi:hypothetical protein